MRSIRSSSPNDYSYNRRIMWLIRLKEMISLYGEFDMRNRLFRENEAKDCQDIEEFRRICFEETDRARQARIHELSSHQKRTIVSRLLTQTQHSQNTVNSSSEAFYDPESASSAGATHVPSQPILDYSESKDHALPRFWVAARHTE